MTRKAPQSTQKTVASEHQTVHWERGGAVGVPRTEEGSAGRRASERR